MKYYCLRPVDDDGVGSDGDTDDEDVDDVEDGAVCFSSSEESEIEECGSELEECESEHDERESELESVGEQGGESELLADFEC